MSEKTGMQSRARLASLHHDVFIPERREMREATVSLSTDLGSDIASFLQVLLVTQTNPVQLPWGRKVKRE
jgi:hypothetical protein